MGPRPPDIGTANTLYQSDRVTGTCCIRYTAELDLLLWPNRRRRIGITIMVPILTPAGGTAAPSISQMRRQMNCAQTAGLGNRRVVGRGVVS